MKRRDFWLGGCLLVVLLCVIAATAHASTPRACAHLQEHEFEVCTAYIANASYAARLPFYQFGSSSNEARATLARHRLESRYTGSARSVIEGQVSGWPSGGIRVSLPSIRIRVVRASLSDNSATLRTVESWSVRSTSGKVLFRERRCPHIITMQRVRGLLLHKWVVDSIR